MVGTKQAEGGRARSLVSTVSNIALPRYVLSHQLSPSQALDAARGMAYLHAHSPPIIHRDVKSPNLVRAFLLAVCLQAAR